jgi:hypothetical protein
MSSAGRTRKCGYAVDCAERLPRSVVTSRPSLTVCRRTVSNTAHRRDCPLPYAGIVAKAKPVVAQRDRIRPAYVTLEELHEQTWLLYEEIRAAAAKRLSTVSKDHHGARGANVAAGRRICAPQAKY